jgi:hypothetical protein
MSHQPHSTATIARRRASARAVDVARAEALRADMMAADMMIMASGGFVLILLGLALSLRLIGP